MENENINPNENQNQQGGDAGNQHAQSQQQNQQQEQPANLGLRTFTQEQLDAIIARERTKATKGWFTAEQMQAKDASITTLTTERDNARAENAKLQEQIDTYNHEKFLSGKGVPADMLEFYAFKIGKLVDDKKNFEQAAEEYLKENPPAGTVRVSTGGSVGGSNETKPDMNATMNAIIRGQK